MRDYYSSLPADMGCATRGSRGDSKVRGNHMNEIAMEIGMLCYRLPF